MLIYEFARTADVLRAELARRTERNSGYSANAFARDLGVSKAYLSLLFSGKRPLTEAAARKLSRKLSLGAQEAEYFELIRKLESARTEEIRKYYLGQLNQFRKSHDVTELSLEQFKVMSDWQHSAILEAVELDDMEPTPEAIAAKLNLPVSDVNGASSRLLKLGLLTRKGKRFQRTKQGLLATSNDISSAALRSFHRQILSMASDALDEQPVEERHVSGMTMAIDPEKLPEAKARIRQFMRDLMADLGTGKKTEVYQISTQLFRLRGSNRKGT
jgi:uncharacterized protein (TIGR02147 family)